MLHTHSHTHALIESMRVASTKMPINFAMLANKNLLHIFWASSNVCFYSGFIYLLLHGEIFRALIKILTCQTSRGGSKPAKWQDIIQLNSFTCIKLH